MWGERVVGTYVQIRKCMGKKNTPLEIYSIYLHNEEIYRVFTTHCIISVSFSTKFCSFYNFIFFSVQMALFFFKKMLKNLNTDPAI